MVRSCRCPVCVRVCRDGDASFVDPRNRKRKLTETGASRDAPPAKKAATAGSTTKVIVKKETKAGTSTSLFTHAKSDSSFFSAPKAKPKLPSFKKAPAAAMATATPAAAVKQERNTAQPMSIDPFQDAMKSLNRGRFGSPVQSTPSSSTVPSASGSVTDPNKKPKKKVHFPPDGKDSLFFVRIVSRVVYDDDPNHDVSGLPNPAPPSRAHVYSCLCTIRRPPTRSTIFATTTAPRAPRCISLYSRSSLTGSSPLVRCP